MFGISQNEPKITLLQEMSQVQADSVAEDVFAVGKKVKQLSYEPARSRLPVSRPWPDVGVSVTRGEVKAAKRSIGLGAPSFWDVLLGSFKKHPYYWLGGSVLAVVVIAIVAGGGKKE